MHEQLLETEVIHADETVVQVLREENRRPERKSYMWTMARPTWWDPIVLFMYFNNRGSRAARDFLNEYQGTVMADGYKVYLSASRKSGFKLAGRRTLQSKAYLPETVNTVIMGRLYCSAYTFRVICACYKYCFLFCCIMSHFKYPIILCIY